jgi:hypothetical protein
MYIHIYICSRQCNTCSKLAVWLRWESLLQYQKKIKKIKKLKKLKKTGGSLLR